MTRCNAFAQRNFRELLRDPLNVSFGIGFPVVLLLMLTAIQSNIPVELFELQALTPGIAVFGLSFISLFSAILISKDGSTAFLPRLLTTPMTALDFILGYTLPLVPLAVAQCGVCYAVALMLGMPFSGWIFLELVMILPTAFIFIGLGLLLGSVLNDKQVGGVCGALLTNLTAWLSGTWFSLDLVGGTFKKVAYALPFAHAVEMGRAVLTGNLAGIFPHFWWVLGYALLSMMAAVAVFYKRMRR